MDASIALMHHHRRHSCSLKFDHVQFQILLDSGSRGYWLNELAFLLQHDLDNALRFQCVDHLLTALDATEDVVQVGFGIC